MERKSCTNFKMRNVNLLGQSMRRRLGGVNVLSLYQFLIQVITVLEISSHFLEPVHQLLIEPLISSLGPFALSLNRQLF